MENNQIQKAFNFSNQQVRTVEIKGEIWFVAKDVCGVLGIASNNVTVHVRKLSPEMRCAYPIQTPNRIVEVNCINEAGLNRLIMRSDKPSAITFQNWIAKEVLPSIRKHGMYLTPEVALEVKEDKLAFLARAVLVADGEIKRLQSEIDSMVPKVELFDNYMDYNGSHSFTDVAKVLGMNVQVLIAHLEADKVLQRNIKKELSPRKAFANSGYFKVKITPKYIHTRVTPLGLKWLTEKYTI